MASWPKPDPLTEVFQSMHPFEKCGYVCLSHHCLCFWRLGPALFKPQNSVAVCCQGEQTTTASHLWQSCSHLPAEVIWFMVHGSLFSQLSFQQNVGWFGFIPVRRKIRWILITPALFCKSHCILFKIFASRQLCTKMQVWMY